MDFGNNRTQSLIMLLLPLWACLHAHGIPVKSLYPNVGIIQTKLCVQLNFLISYLPVNSEAEVRAKKTNGARDLSFRDGVFFDTTTRSRQCQ